MEVTSIHKTSIQLLTPENLFSLLPACHSARRAFLPGVAESTVSKSEGKPSPWGEGAHQGGCGMGESALPRPLPTVCDGPSSHRERELFLR